MKKRFLALTIAALFSATQLIQASNHHGCQPCQEQPLSSDQQIYTSEMLKPLQKAISDAIRVMSHIVLLGRDGKRSDFLFVSDFKLNPEVYTSSNQLLADNPELTRFLNTVYKTLRTVIEYFKSYRNKDESFARPFAENSKSIISFEDVLKLMNQYKRILLLAAQDCKSKEFEQFVLDSCMKIELANRHWNEIIKKQLNVFINISKAMKQ